MEPKFFSETGTRPWQRPVHWVHWSYIPKAGWHFQVGKGIVLRMVYRRGISFVLTVRNENRV